MRSALKTLDLPSRMNVLGTGISVMNMDEAVRRSDALLRAQKRGYICVCDVHSVMEGLRDAAFRKILNGSLMTTADGMPLVWAGRLRKQPIGRVYGPDFLLAMCHLSVTRRYRHFFYGGKPGVAERLVDRLAERFPGLQISGTFTPPFASLTRAEEGELTTLVEESKPDLFWVGLGSPKQERFMAQYSDKLACTLMVGVGAAFDFHSGTVKEAPRWLHNTGLQWAYRVMQEPRRLGKRYLRCIPAFAWNIGLEAAGIRQFNMET